MKKYILFSLIVSIAVYFIISFIYWDITVITQIPKATAEQRGLIIAAWFFKEIFTFLGYTILKD